MVLSLDTEVDTPPDPTPWKGAAATAMPLPRSLSELGSAASLSGMIININKVINLFIRYKT